MAPALEAYDEESALSRGALTDDFFVSLDGKFSNHSRVYLMHHVTDRRLDDYNDSFQIPGWFLSEFSFERVGEGLAVIWRSDFAPDVFFRTPEIFADREGEVFFVGSGSQLNEFGHYYTALYIAGMLTRYYPHLWIKEFRNNSKVSSLIDELVDSALTRLPVLTASALERRIYLYE